MWKMWHSIRRFMGWAVITLSVTLSLWSRYLDVRDTIAFGLSGDIWLTIGLAIFFITVVLMLLQFSRRMPHIPPMGKTNNDKGETGTEQQQYSPGVGDKLDELITQGDALVRQMQRPDFHVGQMGQEVRQWLDITDKDIWRVIPTHASYIVAEQGDITHDEKLRYQGWSNANASLRISVDRRLSRLREIRSKIQTVDSETECKETLQHVVAEEHSHVDLSILRGYAGWPVNYPIRIRNCRTHPVEIIGYNATILWDGTALHRIEWRAPSTELSNGLLVHPPIKDGEVPNLIILADNWYQLDIPVNMTQIPNWPKESPRWTARGVLMFRCGKQTRDMHFNFNTDNYRFPSKTWDEMRDHILGDGN